jgi:hypothetical protein
MANENLAAGLPGHRVSEHELKSLGFAGHDLIFRRLDVHLPGGIGSEWLTLGEVPDAAGLYAFTVSNELSMCVAYVGQTSHLWMVTQGRRPGARGARGGNHYGRPVYAGTTRQRINVLITKEVAHGRVVKHWLCPMDRHRLAAAEEDLIRRWTLRGVGWNRA